MANKNTISVQLTVNDDGSVTMKQFGKTAEDALNKTEAAAKKATSSLTSLKGSYLELSAKAASAYLAVTKAMDYMDKGVKAEQAEASFRTLAAASGESADQIITNMKRATNSTIDDSALMQKAAKAMLLEFSGDQITKMSEAARLAARGSGEDVGAVFDNIVNAISTNMPRALKQYGLITKEQMAIVNRAMAEGVEGIDLYSIAISNLAAQQAKMGPLAENDAEKLQKVRAQIEEVKETFGSLLMLSAGAAVDGISKFTEPLMALLAAGSTTSIAPLEAYFKKLLNIKDEMAKLDGRQGTSGQAGDSQKAADKLRASQELSARLKSDLDTMKALNKTYYADQENNIKSNADLMRAVGSDELKIMQDSIEKRKALLSDYYNRSAEEIVREAASRSQADRAKLADSAYVTDKMKALYADVTAKQKALSREATMSSIQAAQNDIKSLSSRLADYQSYYDSLKAMMDKNIEAERKHLTELQAIRQQRVDVNKSAVGLIAGIKGADESLTAQQRYDAARSGLNQQFSEALSLSGQDRVKALEDYKQAVASLQSQFAKGIPGVRDIFGNVDEVVRAKTIAEDAISDIERATQMQKNALAALAEEKQAQIEADKLWGQTLQAEAQKTQAEMQNLQNIITAITQQIAAMQTTIELVGVDKTSGVVDDITRKIQSLHDLAARPISIGGNSGNYGLSTGADGFTDIAFSLGSGATPVLDQYAAGTPYVPRTGLYQLHQGEAVVPADQNRSGQKGVNINGDIIINVPQSAATGRPEDWRMITRQYIVPELRKMNA